MVLLERTWRLNERGGRKKSWPISIMVRASRANPVCSCTTAITFTILIQSDSRCAVHQVVHKKQNPPISSYVLSNSSWKALVRVLRSTSCEVVDVKLLRLVERLYCLQPIQDRPYWIDHPEHEVVSEGARVYYYLTVLHRHNLRPHSFLGGSYRDRGIGGK